MRMRQALASLVLLAGCTQTSDEPAAAPDVVAPDFLVTRLGGTTSAREFRGRPFNQSARSLSNVEFRRFGEGALSFDDRVTPEGGLGPTFNENSCLGCHLDGVDTVVRDEREPGPGLILRLSVAGTAEHGGQVPEPTYGFQLQTRAIEGAVREGELTVDWKLEAGTYPDGDRYELRTPTFRVSELSDGPLAKDLLTSARIAPPMTGMGLLEAIAETDIVAAADPDDADGDGISGRVNRVWDNDAGATALGRFGWKAGQPTVRQQSVAALREDMGVTLDEIPDTVLADQVFYNRTIAVPIARNVDDDAVKRGANSFVTVGCSSCHTTTQRSGPDEVAGLAGQTFHPFTDLLLHDMGRGLADGRPEFEAGGTEWRTAPLWALGRRAEVTGFSTFLHDGRARTIEEAVLWHGGEAAAARERFMALSRQQRRDVLSFLGAL